MAYIEPINDDHSVVSVAFTLVLSEPIGVEVVNAAMSRPELGWKTDLPGVSQGEVGIQMSANQAIETPTVLFSVVRPDGKPNWLLHFNGLQLSVQCFLYTRWKEVSSRALGYLGQGLTLIREFQPGAAIISASLAVSDSFRIDGEFDAHDLLAEGSVLGSVPFERGALWHLNTGWFEKLDETRLLTQLNVRSTGTAIPHTNDDGIEPQAVGAPYTVAIVHTLQTMPITPWDTAEKPSAAFEGMHLRNKALLFSLLNPAISERIGLSVA